MSSRGCNVMSWLWFGCGLYALFDSRGIEVVIMCSGVSCILAALAGLLKAQENG